MSGGVDSSVAAYLLKQAGYNLVGVTMCLGIADEQDAGRARCCGVQAVRDAQKVCAQLGIPHYVLDFAREMQNLVIKNFVSEYLKGRTPNPCVRCNEYLKFGKLLNYAKNMGFDSLATGHYAKIENIKGNFVLRRPKDRTKEQTYFLYCIKKRQLPFILFPLADYTKNEVRKIARRAGLATAAKSPSEDLCFVGEKHYKEFIAQETRHLKRGNIVNLAGKLLGRHSGIVQYTRGQREGLGVAAAEPLYVVALDTKRNQVIVGNKKDLQANALTVKAVNRLVDKCSRRCSAKVRYKHQEARCTVSFNADKAAKVAFDQPQQAVTPGQSVVFYRNDIVLGGGIIERTFKTKRHFQ